MNRAGTFPTAADIGGWANASAFFRDLFRFPSPEQWLWLHSPAAAALLDGLARFGGGPESASVLPPSAAEYEEEYIAVFDAGFPHPPCPLIETHWNKTEPAQNVIHEHVLFYKRFGLRLSESSRETPDHLRYQLDFHAHLLRLWESAERDPGGGQAGQFGLAERDFRRRRMAGWIAKASAALTGAGGPPWAVEWMGYLDSYLRELEAAIGGGREP